MKISIVKYSLLAFLFIASFNIQAQDEVASAKTKGKTETLELQVSGVCGMCETRIETAVYDLKGVKSVRWDQDSGKLTTIVKKNKVTKQQIADAVAAVGHSSELAKAKKEAYDELPGCCKYDDGVQKHGKKDGHGHK
ncbi:MAG: ATPase [Bacteroidetes bacterium]|nr:MAG: ATPase [Bacteroidota bacterium]